jgi:hypothetical protein
MNGWKHMHSTGYRKPQFSPFLVLLVLLLLFTGGFKWLIIPALFILPMMFFGKQTWQCGVSDDGENEKRKNDEKRKRDDLFYNDAVEII